MGDPHITPLLAGDHGRTGQQQICVAIGSQLQLAVFQLGFDSPLKTIEREKEKTLTGNIQCCKVVARRFGSSAAQDPRSVLRDSLPQSSPANVTYSPNVSHNEDAKYCLLFALLLH